MSDSDKKLYRVEAQQDPLHEEYGFFCPGCKGGHYFFVKYGPKSVQWRKERFERAGKVATPPEEWAFNGNMDKPTFSPSLLYNGDPRFKNPAVPRCHLFLRDGVIEFLPDCEHELAGKKVPL